MEARVVKQGEEYIVVIPRGLAWRVGLTENMTVSVEAEEGYLVIKPRKPEYRLEDLLAQITEENVHGETDTGEPVGAEIW